MPALPPAVNGLGDYAVVLADGLDEHGIASRFVVGGMPRHCNPAWTVRGRLVEQLAGPTPDALVHALERAGTETVLLHFSGYGYARWGLCFWLLQGLTRWKTLGEGRRVVAMFHELYASGPPWRSSFWTSWPQRSIARRLATSSDAVVCGYELIRQRLAASLPDKPINVLPVFSNVQELENPPPLVGRAPLAVVFGGRRRASVYASEPQLHTLFDRLGIERVVDIGPRMAVPTHLAGRPVTSRGILAPSDVSAVLADARLGLADYPRHVAAKSGILAAYHAHGLLALNLTDRGTPMDGLVEGEHYVGRSMLNRLDAAPDTIAAAGHHWYRGHDQKRTADLFAGLLQPAPICP